MKRVLLLAACTLAPLAQADDFEVAPEILALEEK